MRTALFSNDQKKEIPPTIHDTRLNFNQTKNAPSMLKLKTQLFKIVFKIDRNIGFAHVVPGTPVFDNNSLTKCD